jgi:hypothetical protein
MNLPEAHYRAAPVQPSVQSGANSRQGRRSAGLWAALVLLAIGPGSTRDARAQETGRPDQVTASTDTTATEAAPPVRFRSAGRPARRPLLDATWLLQDRPGGFVYEFGPWGWPNAWTPDGFTPNRVSLTLDGRPFQDLFNGRPRYDLLPVDLAEPLLEGGALLGSPVSVRTAILPFEAPNPLTEIRYRAGGGAQGVTVVHSQERSRPLFGNDGILSVTGGYSGRAASGEYAPGTDLRHGRDLLVRAGYRQETWSVEMRNLHNRMRVGAHGGVIPRGGILATIYDRFGASTRNPEAARTTYRNELSLNVKGSIVGGQQTDASAYHVSQIERYRLGADTTDGQAHRVGIQVRQPIPGLGAKLLLDLWSDSFQAWQTLEAEETTRTLRAEVDGNVRAGGLAVAYRPGVLMNAGRLAPEGGLSLTLGIGRLTGFASFDYAPYVASYVERHGFGPYLRPGTGADGASTRVDLGLVLATSAFRVRITGTATRLGDFTDLIAISTADTARFIYPQQQTTVWGAHIALGWRDDTRRGVYAEGHSGVLRVSTDDPLFLDRLTASLPEAFGLVRIGTRATLFLGDLDLNVYVQSRFWSSMSGRTLHPATGMLILPRANGIHTGPSGTIDLHLEAGVREAVIFLSYENALAGTQLLRGNMIVPLYPLPEQRFRFGVHWPIFN